MSKPDRHNFHFLEKMPVICILDNPNSLFNVGTVIRTCAAFRIQKLIICTENNLNLNSKKIKKTSRGGHKWLAIEYQKNIFEVIENFKKSDYSVIAVELSKNSVNYCNLNYKYPVAFILGNEIDGIKDEVITMCDYSIHINMFGM